MEMRLILLDQRDIVGEPEYDYDIIRHLGVAMLTVQQCRLMCIFLLQQENG